MSYVLRDGQLVDKATGEPLKVPERDWAKEGPPLIASDIQPYRSMIDGRMITSRSQHRSHLRAHGCIEVGNEKMEPPKAPKALSSDARRKALHEQLANVTDKQANKVFGELKEVAIRERNKNGSGRITVASY